MSDFDLPFSIHEQVLIDTIKHNRLDWAIDVGAHAGKWTLPLAGMAKMVWAFEPHPGARAALEHNLVMANIRNVTVFPYALGDHDGAADLTTYTHPSHSTLLPSHPLPAETPGINDPKVIPIQVRRLDGIVNDSNAVENQALWGSNGLIKIDTEGGEMGVLTGAEQTVSKWFNPLLFVECHTDANYAALVDRLSASIRLHYGSRDYLIGRMRLS